MFSEGSRKSKHVPFAQIVIKTKHTLASKYRAGGVPMRYYNSAAAVME